MQKIKQFALLCFAMLFGNSGLIAQVSATISDAGNSDVNGVYIWDCSTLNGDENPLYAHENGNYYLHANSSGVWVINEDDYWADEYDSYYYSDAGYDGSTDIPPVENWQVQNGSSPEPTISVNASFNVAGAGDGYLNGVYIYDGATNGDGNPIYQLEDEYYYLHANYDGIWVINDSEYSIDQYSSYYYSDVGYDGNTHIPPPDGWEVQNGASPSPSVGCGVVEPPCPGFDVTLTTQAEVDDFIITYPDCTHPNNTIKINGSDITNLNGLGNIIVAFTLEIQSAPSLTSLSGLANFEGFGSDGIFTIENTGISNLTGLSSMNRSMYYFAINNNPNLSSLEGGAANLFTLVDERLFITGNPALTSLSGLNPLIAINNPDFQLTIGDNQALEELGNLDKFITINRLHIYDNPLLANLNGLQGLISVSDNIDISGETTLNGLENLTSTGNISLSNNTSISDFSDLTSITTVGSLNLNNTSLTSLNGLDQVTALTGILKIQNNSNLTDIGVLADMELNINSLTIIDNSNLSSCAISSICDLLDDNTVSKTISNNATGCSSIAQVTAACAIPELPTAPNTYVATEVEVDADGYSHYYDTDGKLLLSIKAPAGITIPPSAVKVKVGATAATYYDQYCGGTRSGGCFVRSAVGNALINRFWDIDKSQVTGGTISSSTPIDLVFYFTPSDFDALNTELTDNGQSALSGFTNLQAYVVKNTATLPDFPSPTDIGNYRKVYRLSNNSSASTSKWKLGNPSSDIYSMDMKVIRIDNGGGLGKFY